MTANIDKKLRNKVYRRDGYRCALCDSTRYIQIHHVIPRGKGGPNTEHNLVTLCSDCHALAHGMDLRGWGAKKEDVEQAVVECLADLYAEEGIIWNPWGGPEATGMNTTRWEEEEALMDYLNNSRWTREEDPAVERRHGRQTPP